MRVTIGSWLIECDPEATCRCYTEIAERYSCDCAPCRNFAALGLAAFPAKAHEILNELGIDFYKPAEIYHISRLKKGLQLYGGWYHCVGHIESGSDAWQPAAGAAAAARDLYSLHPEALTEHFSIGCTSRVALVPKAFAGYPVIQIEFSAELPWVLDEPEPE